MNRLRLWKLAFDLKRNKWMNISKKGYPQVHVLWLLKKEEISIIIMYGNIGQDKVEFELRDDTVIERRENIHIKNYKDVKRQVEELKKCLEYNSVDFIKKTKYIGETL